MALDWLLGRSFAEESGRIEIRSLVIDLDTVCDAFALIKDRTGDAGLYYVDGYSEPQPLDIDRLDTAADWQLRRLMIRGGPGHSLFSVDIRNGEQPNIYFGEPGRHEAARTVAALMLAEGRPRPRWKPLVPRLPLLAVVAGLGS